MFVWEYDTAQHGVTWSNNLMMNGKKTSDLFGGKIVEVS
jgi:hypothetical protein